MPLEMILPIAFIVVMIAWSAILYKRSLDNVIKHMRIGYRRSRGQCPACGYDLRGVDHRHCPECGREVHAETPTPPRRGAGM